MPNKTLWNVGFSRQYSIIIQCVFYMYKKRKYIHNLIYMYYLGPPLIHVCHNRKCASKSDG